MVGKKKQYTALGDFDKNEMIVRSGSIINIKENIKFKMINDAKNMRTRKDLVDETGVVLQDIRFSSPSTAAQFVTGNSANGLRQWKEIETGKSLKEFI